MMCAILAARRTRRDHGPRRPNPAEAAEVLDGDGFADEREARELGATGVPFFVIADRYGVSGAQPAELFAEALDRAGADTAPF